MPRSRIVFAAEDRISVREVYAAALEAGAIPSQPPGYRSSDPTEFGAAVFDFDGNVIEAVLPGDSSSAGTPRNGEILTWSNDINSQAARAPSAVASRSAAHDAESTVSAAKSQKSEAPAQSATEGDKLGQTLATTLLGVAAGAAVAYGWGKLEDEIWKKESSDAKAEAESHFAKKEGSLRDDRSQAPRSALIEPARSVARSQTSPSVAPSRSVRAIEAPPSAVSGRSRRSGPSVIEVSESEIQPRSVRAIEASPSTLSNSRSSARTIRAEEEPPRSRLSVKSHTSPSLVSHATNRTARTARTALTAKDDAGNRSVVSAASNRSARTAKTAVTAIKDDAGSRSVVSAVSNRSAKTAKTSASTKEIIVEEQAPPSKVDRSITLPSSGLSGVSEMMKEMHNAYDRANQLYNEFQDLTAAAVPLPPSKATSVAPASQSGSATPVPAPASKATSKVSHRSERPPTVVAPPSQSGPSQVAAPPEHNSAAGVPLPASKANTVVAPKSRISSLHEKKVEAVDPVPEVPSSAGEKILDDLATLVPDDSASNIGYSPPPPQSRQRSHSHSRHTRHSDVGRRKGHKEHSAHCHTVSEGSHVSEARPGRRHRRRDSGVGLVTRPKGITLVKRRDLVF